jgi:hypothetical protein
MINKPRNQLYYPEDHVGFTVLFSGRLVYLDRFAMFGGAWHNIVEKQARISYEIWSTIRHDTLLLDAPVRLQNGQS